VYMAPASPLANKAGYQAHPESFAPLSPNRINLSNHTVVQSSSIPYFASRKNCSGIRKLIEQGWSSGENLIDATDEHGATGLHYAALLGCSSVATLLLTHNAYLEVVNLQGATPLLVAVRSRKENVAKLLIEAGAKVDATNVKRGDSTTPLMLAAALGDAGTVQALLDGGADMGLQDENGNVALDFAIRNRQPAAEEVLANTLISTHRHMQKSSLQRGSPRSPQSVTGLLSPIKSPRSSIEAAISVAQPKAQPKAY